MGAARLLQQGIKTKIKMASSHKPRTSQLTHFLCLPLVTPASRPQLSTNLRSFQDDVTKPQEDGGFDLPVQAIRPVGTLHLTLGMMSFPKNEGLQDAVALLKSIKPREILSRVKRPVILGSTVAPATDEPTSSPLLVTLKGLNSMQKPEKATVLYAPPSDPEGVLQGFAEDLRAAFQNAGLLAPDDRPLLLHATVVNMVYVKHNGRNGGQGPRGAKKKKGGSGRNVVPDALAVLNRYEDQVWMEDVPLEKIAICRMGANPVVEEDGAVVDAAYEVEAEIDF